MCPIASWSHIYHTVYVRSEEWRMTRSKVGTECQASKIFTCNGLNLKELFPLIIFRYGFNILAKHAASLQSAQLVNYSDNPMHI